MFFKSLITQNLFKNRTRLVWYKAPKALIIGKECGGRDRMCMPWLSPLKKDSFKTTD